MMFKRNYYSQKGQALLFVVITMTIALALGIGLSLETINSISNVADTDTSQRALAAAEGAAERTLTLSNTELSSLADGISSSECASILRGEWVNTSNTCFVRFTAQGGTGQDPIEVRSAVSVETYEVTDPDNGYSSVFSIQANDVKEVFLEGYSQNNVQVCWDGNADLYYRVYNELGDNVNNIVRCSTQNCHQWQYGGALTASTGSSVGHADYDHCYTVAVSGLGGISNPKGLRIRALGDAIEDGRLFPTPTLPQQGYKISTRGELVNADGIARDVTVFTSFSYTPAVFDFSFYSKDNLTQ